jgi:hypothetical protein
VKLLNGTDGFLNNSMNPSTVNFRAKNAFRKKCDRIIGHRIFFKNQRCYDGWQTVENVSKTIHVSLLVL